MPIDNSDLNDIPNWAVVTDKEHIDTFLEFWNENPNTAYSTDEFQEETELPFPVIIDILTELKHAKAVKKKGQYYRPRSIEAKYEKWKTSYKPLV